jgi:hypothetical protein
VIHQHVDGFVAQLRKHRMTDDKVEMKQVWFLGFWNTEPGLTLSPSGSTGSSLISGVTWRMVGQFEQVQDRMPPTDTPKVNWSICPLISKFS